MEEVRHWHIWIMLGQSSIRAQPACRGQSRQTTVIVAVLAATLPGRITLCDGGRGTGQCCVSTVDCSSIR
jgi:hypothetical protein